MFHNEPAWRKTSIGPIAVEENIWSRRRTVISFTIRFAVMEVPVGLNAYLQWQICHLDASEFSGYFGTTERNDCSRNQANERKQHGHSTETLDNYQWSCSRRPFCNYRCCLSH